MKQFNFHMAGLLLFISLIAGSLFANIYCSDNVSELGVFNYEFMEKMRSMNIDGRNLFQYILMERAKLWALLFLLAFTSIGSVIYILYILIFGFMIGLICSAMVMIYGFLGTIYFAFLCLISQVIYFGAVFVGMFAGIEYRRKRKGGNKLVFLLLLALFLLVLSAGAETMFNLSFIKYFYK